MVCYVSDQSNEMLDLLSHKKIAIGTKLEVKRKFSYDHSMEIKLRNSRATGPDAAPITISEQLAKNIFVKYGS
jgi:DtxR family Mn-dependent transcriptional regulator